MSTRTHWTGACRARAVVAGVALAGALTGTPGAGAATRTIADRNEDGSSRDAHALTVGHWQGPAQRHVRAQRHGRVVVRARVGTLEAGDTIDVWLDTPRGRAVEYAVSIAPDSGYDAVQRVRGWRRNGRAGCSDWEARASLGPDQSVLLSFPRGCFDEPRLIRVALRVSYAGERVDWVPGRRTFTRWVRATRRSPSG